MHHNTAKTELESATEITRNISHDSPEKGHWGIHYQNITCKWHISFLATVKNSLVSRCNRILTNSPVKDCKRPICQCNQDYSFDMSEEKGGTTPYSVRLLCSEGKFKTRYKHFIFQHIFTVIFY